MNYKYRLTFSKTGSVCYLGHLDLLKVFQRSIKRSKIPIAYSNGFNPHQQMSFALPLSLGMEGYNEYLDIELTELIADNFISNLNLNLPKGIEVKRVELLDSSAKSTASIVKKAIYQTILHNIDVEKDAMQKIVNEILESESIVVLKKTKGGLKDTNIRPDIFQLDFFNNDGNIDLNMILSAGSVRNLKPSLVVEYIYKLLNKEYSSYKFKYVRKQLII